MSAETILLSLLVAGFGVALAAMFKMVASLGVRFRKVETDVNTLQTQMSPFWAQVQAKISADLHHPNPNFKEMDGLLEQLENLTITPEGRNRLKILLIERSKDMHSDITEAQRKSAAIMIPVMDKVLVEQKTEEKKENEHEERKEGT